VLAKHVGGAVIVLRMSAQGAVISVNMASKTLTAISRTTS
jgi:hypothetical protein